MYSLMVQELGKIHALLLLQNDNISDAFKQLDYFERNTINPNCMFWIVDSDVLNTLIVPPCTN